MNWKILYQPLGVAGSIGIPAKKEIPLAIPAIMAAGSLVSSFFGSSASKEAAERARQEQLREKARLEAERLRKTNEDYLDTAAGQNALRVAREEADKVWKRAEGAKAVAGGTDAAAAMAKEAGNKMLGDTIANIAANDTQRKDNIDASYRQEISRVNQGIMQSEMAKAQATAQAAGAASNALMQGALMTFGGTKLGQSWFGGSPGGGGVENTASGFAKVAQPYEYGSFYRQAMRGGGLI